MQGEKCIDHRQLLFLTITEGEFPKVLEYHSSKIFVLTSFKRFNENFNSIFILRQKALDLKA